MKTPKRIQDIPINTTVINAVDMEYIVVSHHKPTKLQKGYTVIFNEVSGKHHNCTWSDDLIFFEEKK